MINERGRVHILALMLEVVLPLLLVALLMFSFHNSPGVRRFFSRGPTWQAIVEKTRSITGQDGSAVPDDTSSGEEEGSD